MADVPASTTHTGHSTSPQHTYDARGLSFAAASELVANASAPSLYEYALQAGEGHLTASGTLAVDTGTYTGRSPKDRFIVEDALTTDVVSWGAINQPLEKTAFEALKADMLEHLAGKRLFVQDVFVGAHPDHQLKVRVVTEFAWHSLFAQTLFIDSGVTHDEPDWVVLDIPSFSADPGRHGGRTATQIALDFTDQIVLIANTEYAGEIKKSMFGVLNFHLPNRGVFPMHCSANEDQDGNAALFFGLSGTGKTTLSADNHRSLIGDDEHGWADDGIFNFEGGCYAKVVNLSEEAEPEIFAATERFGTIVENVVLRENRTVDYADTSKTENTRSAYPLEFIPGVSPTSRGGHPTDVIFLTADAFGVLPPISRLTKEQAMYQFLSGYTAKVAGTERGITEPTATFSTCFGEPFMPLNPGVYAELLGQQLEKHGSRAWLVNTGWSGGEYGVGERIKLAYTRALVRAALAGKLDNVEYHTDPIFGLQIPSFAPDVPTLILNPRSTWDNPAAYDKTARKLAAMFAENFARFADGVSPAVKAAGPKVS